MNTSVDLIREKIFALLHGEQYQGRSRPWDTLDVWTDLKAYYESLDDPLARMDFERVVVESLYSDSKALQGFAIEMCCELQIRAAIPWLLDYVQSADTKSYAFATAAFALAAMQVKEAADVFEATSDVALLFRVDYERALPHIQLVLNNVCADDYDMFKAFRIPNSPLFIYELIFRDLVTRFGIKGLFLLLSDLDINTEHQRRFILEAARRAIFRSISDNIYDPEGSFPEQETVIKAAHAEAMQQLKAWLENYRGTTEQTG